MTTVNVVREEPTTPPIREVNLTLSPGIAAALAVVLGRTVPVQREDAIRAALLGEAGSSNILEPLLRAHPFGAQQLADKLGALYHQLLKELK